MTFNSRQPPDDVRMSRMNWHFSISYLVGGDRNPRRIVHPQQIEPRASLGDAYHLVWQLRSRADYDSRKLNAPPSPNFSITCNIDLLNKSLCCAVNRSIVLQRIHSFRRDLLNAMIVLFQPVRVVLLLAVPSWTLVRSSLFFKVVCR
jgi:hypothetical protein